MFDGQVKKLHDATAFVADVYRVLEQYLNSCVVASTTAGVSAPGSGTPVSLASLLQEISWGPYHGVDRLPPALSTILHQRDTRRQDDGLATPGNHENRLRCEEAIQAADRAAGVNGGGRNGGGSGSGGGGGGVRGGGGAGGCKRPGDDGTVHINPHHRPNLALLPGGKTRDVLHTFALPTLGGSTWCKRWHHRGHCFENCPRRGSHITPPASVCTLVADYLTNERNLQEGNDGWRGRGTTPALPPPVAHVTDADLEFSGSGKFLLRG